MGQDTPTKLKLRFTQAMNGHLIFEKNFILNLHKENKLIHLLTSSQLQSAISVIYQSGLKRMTHYFVTFTISAYGHYSS